MAGKRISQLAKELKIESRLIVAKCQEEGIPETVVKTHASTVSAGLEATIREWFADAVAQAEQAAASETSVKKPATKKKKVSEESGEPGTPDGAPPTAVAVEPAEPKAAPAPVTTPAAIKPAVKVEPSAPAAHAPAVDETPTKAQAIAPSTPAAAPTPAAHVKPTPTVIKPTVVVAEPPTSPAVPPSSGSDSSSTGSGEGGSHAAAKAPTSPTPPSTGTGHGPGHSPGHGHGQGPGHSHGRPPMPAHPPASVTMNVPRRPTVIAPAGPKLEIKSPVKLSGPKLIRVEHAEPVETPRPRRFGPGGPGQAGPGGGPGPGSGAMRQDDDRARSPRRGPAGGNSSGANSRRSTGAGVPERRRATSGEDWVGGQVFSEQDLIEREARLARSGGFVKKHKQQQNKGDTPGQPAQPDGRVKIAAPFTIKDLSETTGVKAAEIVKKLFLQGLMLKINDPIEVPKAIEVMMDFDIELEVVEAKTAEETVHAEFEGREAVDLRARGPVVTILGHVDHGKTSLLDKIRNANVASGEAGGITQRTSAFRVGVDVAGVRKEVVFLDTPGHEAFTGMRSRGANMTDMVVLVVSAPEGVMPQTIESINHAKAASVPIVVALNKVDRPDATEQQIQKTLRQLADAGLQPSEWGGDIDIVRTSAVSGAGIKELLETLDYQAALKELKADFGGAARGTVIEARQQEGRGATASLLVQQGKLKVGDFIVAGRAFGRVRDISDDTGSRVKEAGPPCPVQISGLDLVPDAGDKFYVVDSLRKAEDAAEQRRHRERETELAKPKLTLDNIFGATQEGDVKEIKLVVKAAEQGTVDVLIKECEKISTPEIRIRVLHSAIGGITESDVVLADASRAIIIGFNVIPTGKSRSLAEQKGVEIRTYDVIYNITEDLKLAAEGMLSPEIRQEVLGHAEVRQVFNISKVGTIAGCYVTDGVIERNALIRVTRGGIVVQNDRQLEQLKRFKDDAKEVRSGMECGMKIVAYDDIKTGDILECYRQVEFKRTLGGGVVAPPAEKERKQERSKK